MTNPSYLLELEELRQLKARYFRFIDTKSWAELPSVFSEDFVYLDDAKQLVLTGREEFVDFIVQRHTNSVSVHQGYNPELKLNSETQAQGIWAMSDYVILPVGNNGRTVQKGSGHYHEQYVKEDGIWKMKRTHLTRIWLSIEKQEEVFKSV